MKSYLVQIHFDGETTAKMMTIKELADSYEMNDIAGVGMDYSTWDVDSFGMIVKVNTYEVVSEYLKGRREMQQEYDDYCAELRYYGG